MIKVLHLITASEQNKGVGGAETLLLSMLERVDKKCFNFILAHTSGGVLTDDFKKAGAEVEQFDTRSQFDIFAIRKLINLVKEKNVDIIHSHQPRFDFLGCIAAKITKTPIIFTRHLAISEFGINRFKKAIFLNVDKLVTVKWADKIIAASKSIADDLIRKEGAPQEKVTVIYAGLDLKLYDKDIKIGKIREEFSVAPNAPLIGTIGRINVQKAHHLFLEAAVEVLKIIPDARFFIVGDGPLRNKQEKLAEKLGLKSKVIFTGHRKDIPEIIASLDISALSSITEALAIVNLEAMAMRKPVVSFNVGGVSELVIDKETGLLIASGDTHAFADAIIDLIKDKKKAEKMGLAGRKRVEDNFTAEIMVKRHEELYRLITKTIGINRCQKK